MQNWLIVGIVGVLTLLLFVWFIVRETNKLNLPKSGNAKPLSRMSRKQLRQLKRMNR